MARLRGLCRRDGHVGWLAERGRSVGLCLVCLGLGPGLFEGQGLDGVEGGVRVGGDDVAGLVLVARHVTRRRLVPLLVRSLTLAIPPFKVIDIHTGRPLGLANKHLPALYPQMARRLAGNVTKGLSLCHILRLAVGDLVSQQEVDRPYDSDAVDVCWMLTIPDDQDLLVRIRDFSQRV